MKKVGRYVVLALLGIVVAQSLFATAAIAQFYPQPGTPIVSPYVTPEPCRSGGSPVGSYCPNLGLACDRSTPEKDARCDTEARQYAASCANSYEEWTADKSKNFWVHDPEVTALGKGGERSRQFLLWVLTHRSIDSSPVILDVWKFSATAATFLILIVAIIMGISIIIGQRANFNLKIEISPLIIRLALLLLFVIFSARLVLVFIQIADIIMEFFIRQLGVRELFNIFFVSDQSGEVIKESERAYREFIGCTNWRIDNVEMVRTSKFLVKFTNMTYYFIGIMLILRKVVLWFLLIISPFLAILAPFIFIRNIGWIWIGVFFQWVFYGPIFSLFLGALAKIWNSPPSHIPFIFDFSRTHQMSQAVYPTSINILYGGPAQTLSIWNSSNYVDTFAEYVISLIMLWTVIILPWWLLRIFRDYCCDGIIASKNILLSMYDTMRNPPPPPPSQPGPTPSTRSTGLAREIPRPVEVSVKLDTAEQVQRAQTQDIMRSVSIHASNLTDIARMESVKETRETVRRNIDYIANPQKAQTASEKQKFMTIRTEIFNRATKGDSTARSAVSAMSVSDKVRQRAQLLATVPRMIPVVQTIAVKFRLPQEKTRAIVSRMMQTVARDVQILTTISQHTGVSQDKTIQVLQAASRTDVLQKPSEELLTQVATETGVQKEQVKAVITQTAIAVKQKTDVAQKVAQEEQVEQQVVEQVVAASLPAVSEPEKHIEAQVAPAKVSIEEYEQVKSMWAQQYEKGEVPVSPIIPDRPAWVAQDIVQITNILNKLLSVDQKMRAQALDEVGYILPIFMVNGMSGEQLVTYLRAKLEAAKQVQEQTQREQEIRAQAPEEFVEIDRPKEAVKAKEQTLQEEMEIGQSQSEVGQESVGVGSDGKAPGVEEERLKSPEEELKKKLEGEMQK